MQSPKSFGGYFGILNQSMFIVMIMYGAIGFFGYIKYGPECEGSVTLNLPQDLP